MEPTILEVWRGGIPNDARALPRCAAEDCIDLGAHSHTQRISEAPFSIPWQGWIKHHMTTPPTLVVHVYGQPRRPMGANV